jgi:hypothetical protein
MQFESSFPMFIFLITWVNFNFLICVLFLLSTKILTALYCDIDKEGNHNLDTEWVLLFFMQYIVLPAELHN